MRTEIKLNDLLLELLVYGEGPKKMIAFHGFDNDANEFDALASFLPEYTIVSVNLFFHGKSTASQESVLKGLNIKTFIRLNELIMEKFPADKYDLIAFSLGGRIALSIFEHMNERIDRLILLAPDGLKSTIMYRFVTRTFIGKKIFGRVLKDPKNFLSLASSLSKIKLIDNKKIRFLKYNLENEERRKKVFNAWTIYRFIIPDINKIKDLINNGDTKVDLFFGKYDVLMRPSLGKKFISGVKKNCEVHVLQTGHNLISEKNLKAVADLIRES